MLCPLVLIINASRLVVELTDPNLEDGLIEQFSRLASVGLPRNSSFTKFRENSFSFCEAKYLIFFQKIGGCTQKIHISQKNSYFTKKFAKNLFMPTLVGLSCANGHPPTICIHGPGIFIHRGAFFLE